MQRIIAAILYLTADFFMVLQILRFKTLYNELYISLFTRKKTIVNRLLTRGQNIRHVFCMKTWSQTLMDWYITIICIDLTNFFAKRQSLTLAKGLILIWLHYGLKARMGICPFLFEKNEMPSLFRSHTDMSATEIKFHSFHLPFLAVES